MKVLSEFRLREPTEPECPGIFFRADHAKYFNPNDNSIQERVRLRFLKKKSCQGCEQCGWIFDSIMETMDNVILGNIRAGKMYSPHATDISRDRETSQIDDYNIGFEEVEE